MWESIETIPHFQFVEVYSEEFEKAAGSNTKGITICSYNPATNNLPEQFIELTGLVMLWKFTHWRHIRPKPTLTTVIH